MEKNIKRLARKIQQAQTELTETEATVLATNWSKQILSCDMDDLLASKADEDFFITALEAFLYA